MRFVSLRFPSGGTFLDIGCGEGANARELWRRNYEVSTIDKDPKVRPVVRMALGWHICGDICDIELGGLKGRFFNLIYDINTLCHVEYPPWEKIKNALMPEGIFFSICPTYLAPPYIANGKEFTRTYSEGGLRETLQPYFSEIKIYSRNEPDFKWNQLDSWIVEARP